MLKLLIVEKDKDGKITLTAEKLEQMLMDAYVAGKNENKNCIIKTPNYPLDNLNNIKWTSRYSNDNPDYTIATNDYITTTSLT